MAGIVRWFKSGGVVLTKFSPLRGRDDGEDDHEMETEPRSSEKNVDGEELPDVYTVEEAVDKLGFGLFQVLITLFAGVIWLTEAFEVMILSILSAALKCQWELSYVQEASITMVVFLGFLVGAPVWGAAADKFGRKIVLFVVMCGGFIFGIVSSFSPGYYTLLLFRGLLGFCFGGGFLGVTYCLEFLPARTRAVIVCLLELAWAIGSVLEALLALGVMTSIDHEPWRWLLGLSALPLLPVILIFPFIPGSPRYLVLHGKEEKAKKVLALMAWLNCKQPLTGRVVTQEEKEKLLQKRNQLTNGLVETSMMEPDDESGELELEPNDYGTLPNKEENSKMVTNDNDLVVMSSDNESDHELLIAADEGVRNRSWYLKKVFKEKAISYYHWLLLLFKNGWWRTTLLLWYLWLSANVVYYGGTLLTTSLFQHDEHCGFTEEDNGNETCKPLSKSDYIHLVWTTCAEFPGTLWIILLLLVIGRKKSMALTTAAAAVCYGLLFLCVGKTLLTVFLFGIRGFATGFFQAIYLYTPEVYPTSVRGFGMSLCSSFSRIGAMFSPYIAQTLLAYSTIATISVFIGFSVLASVAALLLPIETRGRAMKDSGG